MIGYCLDDQALIPGWGRAFFLFAVSGHNEFLRVITRA
jgi:hypothetical protein